MCEALTFSADISYYQQVMSTAALPPPPDDTFGERWRDRRRSLAELNKPAYWMLTRGAWWFLSCGVLFVVDGILLGWTTAYEVLTGITSPAHTAVAPLAWLLSLVGWLIVPALVGGIVGYVVSRQVDLRRTESEAEFVQRIVQEASSPPSAAGSS